MTNFGLNSALRLDSGDYKALASIVSKSPKEKDIKKLAESLEKGEVNLTQLISKDDADKIAKYFSKRNENVQASIDLWQEDDDISNKDIALAAETIKDIDSSKDGTISTKEFSNALMLGKITIGKLRTPPTLFKTDDEKNNAQKFLEKFSGYGGDSSPIRTVEDRLLNIKPINLTGLKGNMKLIQAPENNSFMGGNNNIPTVTMDDLKGSNSLTDISTNFKTAVGKYTGLTGNALDDYIKENFNSLAQLMTQDIPYEGFVSPIGDSSPLGTIANGSGVCNDIHAVNTALRQSLGQEAYLVMTSGSDAMHVFSVFKEDGTWNIQNYGMILKTDAKTITELFDQAMPEQRKIKIYDVDSSGNVKQVTTDHLTAMGLAERRFRAESGVGGFDPWTAQNGLTVGNNKISIVNNGAYFGFDPTTNSFGLGLYKKDELGDTRKIMGGAIEGSVAKNQYGYNYSHLDAKFETELKYDNAEKQNFGREHFSVFGGIEKSTVPTYWGGISDGSTPVVDDGYATRLGVSYARNDSKLFGDSPIKFELGHQTKAGITLTVPDVAYKSGELSDLYKFGGRMYGDLTLESKLVTGMFVQPNKDLTVRFGLATGLDLPKADGFKDIPEQLKNVFESDAYLDVSYSKGPIAVNAMGYVPLTNPTQYKFGGGVAVTPIDNLAIGVSYLNERIVNDVIDSAKIGIQYNPADNITLGASLTTPLFGDTAKNTQAGFYFEMKF